MKWITAADLERWGEGIPARTELPGLVGDLIRATASDITAFRFPSGDKGQVRGFDGNLVAEGGSPFVPSGRSYWEFGASKAQAAKFRGDIEGRIEQVPEEERADITFVFVTPQTWDNPREKIEDALRPYQESSGWKDVRYIDGVQLESWLDDAPAVAATHARLTLRIRPQIGARSCEEFWDSYSGSFRVDLTEEVLLCGREEHAQKLIEHLLGQDDVLRLTADSPDEVIAFAVAAIRKAPPDQRHFLEARTLIVDTEEAAFELRASERLAFLVRDKARPQSGMLSRAGPTVVGQGYDQKRGNEDFLGNPSFHEMAKALATMDGISEEEGALLARKAGRSVTILARTIPRGAADNPAWLDQGRTLIPSLLAGGWDSRSEEDRRIIGTLTPDGNYDRLEEALRPLSRMQDAPIDLLGSVWQMRAPVDAFVHLGHLLTKADLERLKAASGEVFGTIIPEADENEPFTLARERPSEFSHWLRTGLATTLLQIAVLSEQANLSVAGIQPQAFVDEIIRSLPGLAEDTRLLISIRDELPILMEAAPDPLFEALEKLLEGDPEVTAPLLRETEEFLSFSSALTDVLWALERLAWDPAYLERSSRILARLAERDPGGRLANRPINSLRTIFLAWLPSTHAKIDHRLAVLEAITAEHDTVGWELLMQLLPQSHSTTSLTSKPRFRDAGASEQDVLTVGDVRRTYVHVISRAIELAGDQSPRWVRLVKEFPDFPPGMRPRFYDRLEALLGAVAGEDRQQVWAALREQVRRHRSYSDAAWALPDAELERLEGILAQHEPDTPLERHRWLFDEWMPDVPGDFEEREVRIEEARTQAVAELYEHGLSTLLKAAEAVQLPHLLGSSVAKVLPLDVLTDLAADRLGRQVDGDSFLVALSADAHRRFPADWEERVRSLYAAQMATDGVFAALLIAWPDQKDTWEYVSSLGEAVEREYWLRKQPFRIRDDDERGVLEAIETYLRFGRPSAALHAGSDRFSTLPANILFSILDELPKELGDSTRQVDQLTGYHIEKALDALSARSEVELSEVAKREYMYLDLFRYGGKKLSIHQLMAEDPNFYFSVIRDVFKKRSTRARRSLLRSNWRVPELDIDCLASSLCSLVQKGKPFGRIGCANGWVR